MPEDVNVHVAGAWMEELIGKMKLLREHEDTVVNCAVCRGINSLNIYIFKKKIQKKKISRMTSSLKNVIAPGKTRSSEID